MTDEPEGASGSLGTTGRIVVGIDGSEGSHRALHWAIDEAVTRRSVVEAVAVWKNPYDTEEMDSLREEFGERRAEGIAGEEDDKITSKALERLRSTVADIAGQHPPVKIEPKLVAGDPAETLCQLSADADLLVVGCRGRGGFIGLVLGSVSTKCALHAHCPLVIVPKPDRSSGDG